MIMERSNDSLTPTWNVWLIKELTVEQVRKKQYYFGRAKSKP